MENIITKDQINWRGITIEVTHQPNRWNAIAHIEVNSINPPKAPLPITETGYRSHFLPIGALEAEGITAKELVLQWLEERATSKEWKKQEEESQQLSLF